MESIENLLCTSHQLSQENPKAGLFKTSLLSYKDLFVKLQNLSYHRKNR